MKNEISDEEMVKKITEMNKNEEIQRKLEEDKKNELNSAKLALSETLNNIIIQQPYPSFVDSDINSDIIISSFDNINDYVNRIIRLVDSVQNHHAIPFLSALKNSLQIINEYKIYVLKPSNDNEFSQYSTKYFQQVTKAYDEFMDYIVLEKKFSRFTFDAISSCITDVEQELTKFKRLRGIADTALTEDIYNNATQNFRKQATINKVLFIGTLLLIAYIATVFEFPKELTLNFWMPKITLSLIGITLVTYFLKQSSHYQKLADQSYQTQVELQALPSFISNISNHESAELIRKELALKYFGKEIDGAPHKDLSNLITDQMKSTTELVKATTSMLKKP